MTLVESLRMEVACIDQIEVTLKGAPSLFRDGMVALGVKLRAAANEIERLEHMSELAFQMLESYGIPRERAKSIVNGIGVLAERYRKAELFDVVMMQDAAHWRTFMNCARFKIMGAAGLQPGSEEYSTDYAHIWLELWTIHPAKGDAQDKEGREWFEKFMAKARKVQVVQSASIGIGMDKSEHDDPPG